MHTSNSNHASDVRNCRLRFSTARLAWILAGILTLGIAGSGNGQTFVAEWANADIGRLGPTGLAIDNVGGNRYLYVADQPGGRIIKIDLATGTRVAAWGQTGTGALEFNGPYGVAVDPSTHDIYVAERTNHRVQRITDSGQFVMAWGDFGSAPGQFNNPIGIAADASGNVYVVDHDNDRVEKFDVVQTSTGWQASFVAAWGSKGSGNGQFDAPYGITLGPDGNLWVADGGNHRIEIFDTSGTFVRSVGSYGTGDGQFVTPTWVNFDPAGNYYVAETNSNPQDTGASDIAEQRIQKFSPSGAFLLKWGSYGDGNLQFKLPFDVVVDDKGFAYVSDYYNTRLLKFDLNGTTAASQLVNVSSRLGVSGQPGRELIAGFVISGTASKQVLIRAVGPSLSQFGVSGTLPNPGLLVVSGSTTVASNEDWGGDSTIASAAARTGAFPLNSNLDAAVLVTLPPGVYSAQVLPNGGGGIAVVEVYDADGSSDAKLINISTRGYVDTGDGVLIGGFVVSGTAPKRVLVRGVGPGLAPYGVSGWLANPVLDVYASSNTLIAENDDWEVPVTVSGGNTPASGADITAAASASGAFQLSSGSKDSAVLLTLQPGTYSAVVKGAGGTTGTALVEVYEVPGSP